MGKGSSTGTKRGIFVKEPGSAGEILLLLAAVPWSLRQRGCPPLLPLQALAYCVLRVGEKDKGNEGILHSVPLKIHVHLEHSNVTLFGNGVFADRAS